ncbi:MAG TPA: toll/interleukin-1 receptor domain-containing protein [Alphaproteobacteria bacterium]|jgi:hypothetical protein
MKVFISYSRDAAGLASHLAEVLEDAGFDTWLPERDTVPGENLFARMGEALESASAMVILFTPASADSPWVQREIEYALGNERFKGRVVPVLVGTKTQSVSARIPWILKRLSPGMIELPRKSTKRQLRKVADVLKAAA